MDIVCLHQLILSAAVNFISIFFVRAILFELTTEAFIYKFSMWKTLYHSTKKNQIKREKERRERDRMQQIGLAQWVVNYSKRILIALGFHSFRHNPFNISLDIKIYSTF